MSVVCGVPGLSVGLLSEREAAPVTAHSSNGPAHGAARVAVGCTRHLQMAYASGGCTLHYPMFEWSLILCLDKNMLFFSLSKYWSLLLFDFIY